MSNTETKSRTGEDVSPVARVSAAMAGLIGDYKALAADLEQKLAKQEERLTMLDHKTALAKRPTLSTRTEAEAPHQKALDAYLRSGDDDGLRGLELEGKAMSTAVNADGGYLVDPQTSALIRSKLESLVSIRAISNVVNVEAAAFDVLIDRNDTPGNWELFQFRDATLMAENIWQLDHRLRGQAGSDGIMPDEWPIGSYVVLMNGAPQQVSLAPGLRRVTRNWRIGPTKRSYDDPTYRHEVLAFDGNGLRPYRPAHLAMKVNGSGLDFSWVRRTRIDGDSWDNYEVPLGEDSEGYILRILDGETTIREVQTTTPAWTYTATHRAQDGQSAFIVAVAQVSSRYGPGPFARLVVAE